VFVVLVNSCQYAFTSSYTNMTTFLGLNYDFGLFGDRNFPRLTVHESSIIDLCFQVICKQNRFHVNDKTNSACSLLFEKVM